MRLLLSIIFIASSLVGCSVFSGIEDLKSPCVANESLDGAPTPCIRRNANDHWLS